MRGNFLGGCNYSKIPIQWVFSPVRENAHFFMRKIKLTHQTWKKAHHSLLSIKKMALQPLPEQIVWYLKYLNRNTSGKLFFAIWSKQLVDFNCLKSSNNHRKREPSLNRLVCMPHLYLSFWLRLLDFKQLKFAMCIFCYMTQTT